MDIARMVATRATCDRKHVGAMLVRDRIILSTGYNGSIRGMPHCSEVGHLMENGHCVATIHAEANAILQAARNGVRIEGADIYTTASPCWSCFKLIANAGLTRIVFGEFYRDERIFEFAAKISIELVSMEEVGGRPCLAIAPDLRPGVRQDVGGRGASSRRVRARFGSEQRPASRRSAGPSDSSRRTTRQMSEDRSLRPGRASTSSGAHRAARPASREEFRADAHGSGPRRRCHRDLESDGPHAPCES